MSKLSKLKDAIEHLEAAESLLLDVRYAFKVNSMENDKLTDQADRARKAADAVKSVLAHVEAGIYRDAKQRAELTACPFLENRMLVHDGFRNIIDCRGNRRGNANR